jgi:hypothetical protein
MPDIQGRAALSDPRDPSRWSADDLVSMGFLSTPELAAKRQRGANYISAGLFKPFAVRDGRLVTGQQQYSGRRVAQIVIDMLGV